MKLLIFIPGVGGTKLIHKHKSTVVYPGNLYEYFRGSINPTKFELLLDAENIVPRNVLKSYNGVSIYKKLERYLKTGNFMILKAITFNEVMNVYMNKKCSTIVYFFPWNWLNGVTKATLELVNSIKLIYSLFRQINNRYEFKLFIENVVLCGHSAGGLIAYNALNHLENISQILTIATPFNGATTAIKLLADDFEKSIGWFSVKQLTILLDCKKYDIFYELLPSDANAIKLFEKINQVDFHNKNILLHQNINHNLQNFKNMQVFIYNMKKMSKNDQMFDSAGKNPIFEKFKMTDGVIHTRYFNLKNAQCILIDSSKDHKFIINSKRVMKNVKFAAR